MASPGGHVLQKPSIKQRAILAVVLGLFSPWARPALQAQGVPAQRTVPPTAKASAPIDLTGYWTAVLTEDWHVRMFTAPKGDFGSGPPGALAVVSTGRLGVGANPAQDGNIPYNVKGAQAAMGWDPAKDESEGNQCKAYGAAGIMRQPTHLHITWQDENTLKTEADFGTQTRLLHFGAQPKQEEPTLQGFSTASWIAMGGTGGQANFEKGGVLRAVTTQLKAGYYWKNGMPYTANAVLKENFFLLNLPDGSTWMTVTQMMDDPEYLTQPYVVNYHFKKLPDGSKWNPTPCVVR
jgi:hypothetical protein